MKYLIFSFLLLTASAQAAIELREFEQPEQQVLYQQMLKELRCVVCQNQNLAESTAPIAQDLRNQLYQLISQQNADQQQIKQYMTDRYGDFVLYKPPVQANTWLLWFAPILLLGFAIWLGYSFIRTSQNFDSKQES